MRMTWIILLMLGLVGAASISVTIYVAGPSSMAWKNVDAYTPHPTDLYGSAPSKHHE